MNYSIEFDIVPNTRNLPKPNEDLVIADTTNGIVILLDGITRVHAEYDQKPYTSAACDVNEIFAATVYAFMTKHKDWQDKQFLLKEAARLGNLEIVKYREKKSLEEWQFYPATVGIIAILEGNTLHYACVGDCIGVVLRNNAKILFGKQFSMRALDLLTPSKQERYSVYCNHPENPLSYSVFNGDDAVIENMELCSLDLKQNDIVLLASDGIGTYVECEKNATLAKQSPAEMISASAPYDLPPYASYADDKAIVKIHIG